MNRFLSFSLSLFLCLAGTATQVSAQTEANDATSATAANDATVVADADQPPQPIAVALLGVYDKGIEVRELAPKINSLLMASLSTRDDLVLVEREEIDKVISELELNLSGMVDSKTANQIGHMTGARILISAATFEVDGNLYIVAKLIGVETTRVIGVTAKAPIQQELDLLVEKLADDVTGTVAKRQSDLIVPKKSEEDRLAALKKKIGDAKLPTLAISLPESHVGKYIADPAAQTELMRVCRALGFTVIDSPNLRPQKADLTISGQAKSEFAMQRQSLVGVRARVDLIVKGRDGKVLVADRQTISQVGLTERIAGKVAIEEATLQLAERIIPQIVEQWNKK